MQLQCPMPKLDFDIITLGHGSGGTLTSQLLNAGVFKLLQNDLLNKKHDGAIFNLTGKVAMSTDSYVVSPIFFEGGNIGLVKDEDIIQLDARTNSINLMITDEELEQRRKLWKQPEAPVKNGVLYKYFKQVKNASEGCVTDEE